MLSIILSQAGYFRTLFHPSILPAIRRIDAVESKTVKGKPWEVRTTPVGDKVNFAFE